MNKTYRQLIKEKNWEALSYTPGLSSKDLEKFKYRLNWGLVSKYQKLSSKDLEKYKDLLDWDWVSEYQKLSSKDLEKYKDLLDWDWVSEYQKLSSKDLEKFKDRLNWGLVSKYQKLSSKDLEKYKDLLDWDWVSQCQKLSSKDLEKYKDKIDLKLQETHHKEKSLEQKLKEIKAYAEKHNLKFDGEFLYAFREHDQCGRGAFNKTISYKKGNYYRDWHVDMNPYSAASFGLGIWPKGNTPVKVAVEDWGLEVPNDKGKCRVWGFTVLDNKE